MDIQRGFVVVVDIETAAIPVLSAEDSRLSHARVVERYADFFGDRVICWIKDGEQPSVFQLRVHVQHPVKIASIRSTPMY